MKILVSDADIQSNRPLWSVMIPTFNPVQAFFRATLQSVLDQDEGPDKMLIEVIDDCSTEVDVAAIVHEVAGERITVFQQPQRQGLPANWNTCIDRAQGEWVHILHQDDVILPGFYQAFSEVGTHEPTVGAAFCRHHCVDEQDQVKWTSSLWQETPGILSNFLEIHATENQIQTPSLVVRRSVYENLGGYDPQFPYCADWDMTKRIAAHYAIWYEPRCLAWWRSHRHSATSRLLATGDTLADIRRSIAKSYQEFPHKISTKAAINALRIYIERSIKEVFSKFREGNLSTTIAQSEEILKTLHFLKEISKDIDLYDKYQHEEKQYCLDINFDDFRQTLDLQKKLQCESNNQSQFLANSQQQIESKEAEIIQLKLFLQETEHKLMDSQSQLHEMELIFEQVFQKFQSSQNEIEKLHYELMKTQDQLNLLQSEKDLLQSEKDCLDIQLLAWMQAAYKVKTRLIQEKKCLETQNLAFLKVAQDYYKKIKLRIDSD